MASAGGLISTGFCLGELISCNRSGLGIAVYSSSYKLYT
jgi:hypothetical protein